MICKSRERERESGNWGQGNGPERDVLQLEEGRQEKVGHQG